MAGLLDWLDSGATVGTRLRALDAKNKGSNAGLLAEFANPDAVLNSGPANFASGLLGPMGMGLAGATMYHGSPRKFDVFDLLAPKTTAGGLNKHGVSVSRNEDVAKRYASDFSKGRGYVYKADLPDSAKLLPMSARDFEYLQTLVGHIDSGKPLTEMQDVGLEMLMKKYNLPHGKHPIETIKNAGYQGLDKDAGRFGAELETLVFDPGLLQIVKRYKGE